MTRQGRVFQPNADHLRIDDQLYQRVYRKMCLRLQPLYQEIADITGYPG